MRFLLFPVWGSGMSWFRRRLELQGIGSEEGKNCTWVDMGGTAGPSLGPERR